MLRRDRAVKLSRLFCGDVSKPAGSELRSKRVGRGAHARGLGVLVAAVSTAGRGQGRQTQPVKNRSDRSARAITGAQ